MTLYSILWMEVLETLFGISIATVVAIAGIGAVWASVKQVRSLMDD